MTPRHPPAPERITLSAKLSRANTVRFRKKDVWCTRGGCGSFGAGFVENAPGNKCVGWCWESEITLDQIDDYEIIYLEDSIMSANKNPLTRAHVDLEKLTNW